MVRVRTHRDRRNVDRVAMGRSGVVVHPRSRSRRERGYWIPSDVRLPRRIAEAIVVDVETGCWIWQHSFTSAGRGQVHWNGRNSLAYRTVFLLTFGWLPPMLHHRCERPACVNPFHLSPKKDDAEHKIEHRQTRCSRGHDLTDPENVYLRRSRSGGRSPQCRPCKTTRERERRARSNL